MKLMDDSKLKLSHRIHPKQPRGLKEITPTIKALDLTWPQSLLRLSIVYEGAPARPPVMPLTYNPRAAERKLITIRYFIRSPLVTSSFYDIAQKGKNDGAAP